MASVNKAIIVGNLGADPELRHTPNGQAVCELRIATSSSWTKNGEKHEQTEWHRVVVWGKQAEATAKYLSKGRQVYVEGRIQTRSWDDKDGTKRYMTEIIASDVQFLGGKGGDGNERVQRTGDPSRGAAGDVSSMYSPDGGGPDDDIPF